VVVVSDEADRIVYQRRLPNDPIEIRAALAPHREELVGVVIEATYNWYWLVDALIEDGYRVHLAKTRFIAGRRMRRRWSIMAAHFSQSWCVHESIR
jgi:transposase